MSPDLPGEKTPKPTAAEVEALGDAITSALQSYRCQHTFDCEGNGLDLLDKLAPPGDDTIGCGKGEMELLADALFVAVEPSISSLAAARDELRAEVEQLQGSTSYGSFSKQINRNIRLTEENESLARRVKELEAETENQDSVLHTLQQRLKAAAEMLAKVKPYIDNGTDQTEFVCDECAVSKSPGMVAVALELATYREGRE